MPKGRRLSRYQRDVRTPKEISMFLLLAIAALAFLGMLASAFGVDSRDGFRR